jgi:hypothetical protein
VALKSMDESRQGAHHCTRENISYTIGLLRMVEDGTRPVDLQDWRTQSGIIALQLEWLLGNLDN